MGPSSSDTGLAVSPSCSDCPLLFLPAARSYVPKKEKKKKKAKSLETGFEEQEKKSH